MSPEVETAPGFGEREAEDLAERLFGVRGAATPLPSERDQNFRIESASGARYVLKLANAGEPVACLEFQNALLERLGAAGLPFAIPFPLPLADGSERRLAWAEGRAGRRHAVRMLTWVDGEPMADARPRSAELLVDLGRGVGVLDRALEGFRHPGMERALRWDLVRTAERRPALALIARPERRRLAKAVLERFEGRVAPRLAGLPASVVHGDWNEHNVLVGPVDAQRRRVVGLLDFGDALLSRRVCDPAVAIAYAMLDQAQPLQVAARVTAGYARELTLLDAELDVLWDLALARLAISVLISADQCARAPDNAYLAVSERPAWELLERLESVDPDWARYRLRDAAARPAHPARAAVVAALEARRGSLGPVLGRSLAGAPVLDLGVDSPDVDGPQDPASAREAAREMARRIADAGASVAIGRYDEVRLVYAGEAFRTGPEPGAEWRTVHLGVDLFAPAGERVLAPLDGEVHSFADNAAPLDYGPTLILRHRLEPEGLELFTLYGHLSRESLRGLKPGRRLRRGDSVGTLGDESVNGGWAPHLHFQILLDTLGRRGDFPGVAAPGERSAWLGLCPDPNLILGVPGLAPASREPSRAELLAVRSRHFSTALSLSYRSPLVIVRGRGARLWDREGRGYLDAVNNVAHVGHAHPRVTEALARQARLLNTNTRYLHPLRAEYARRLTALFPEPLSVVFLVCSGSEANELALRLARAHAGARGVVVLGGAYHGHTSQLVGISPYKYSGPGGTGPDRDVFEVPLPDPYRGPHRGPDAGRRYGEAVAAAAEAARGSEAGLAAFFAESLPGCGGQIVPPAGFLETAYRGVREAGGVCVADEVQVGFGRVGDRFWGFELQDVVPDIVTLGKPIGNGHPLAAVVTTQEIARSFETGMEYFNSFGGNPVSCAVGLAVLDVIEEEGLQENARRVGRRLSEGLRRLTESHPIVGDVRGSGLYLGVELVRDRETLEPAGEEAAYVVQRMCELGVLISRDGPLVNVLKIKPPLVFSETDADHLVAVLDLVLGEDFPRRAPERAGRSR